jgi:hypothetical protein
MSETNSNELGLALIYIEYERQMCTCMRHNDHAETARLEGLMQGILIATKLLGIKDFYGTTISNLRYAIQEERKEKE